MAQRPPNPSSFLQLPPEIRSQIYTHLFHPFSLPCSLTGPCSHRIPPSSSPLLPSLPPLLFTSRFLHREALPAFYRALIPHFKLLFDPYVSRELVFCQPRRHDGHFIPTAREVEAVKEVRTVLVEMPPRFVAGEEVVRVCLPFNGEDVEEDERVKGENVLDGFTGLRKVVVRVGNGVPCGAVVLELELVKVDGQHAGSRVEKVDDVVENDDGVLSREYLRLVETGFGPSLREVEECFPVAKMRAMHSTHNGALLDPEWLGVWISGAMDRGWKVKDVTWLLKDGNMR